MRYRSKSLSFLDFLHVKLYLIYVIFIACYDGHAWEAPPVWRLGDKPVAYFPFDAIDCFTLKSRKIRQANPRESLTTGVVSTLLKKLCLDHSANSLPTARECYIFIGDCP